MSKRVSTYIEMLEVLCNKATVNLSFSNVDKKLGMLSNYIMAVEVLDRFVTLRNNIRNGVIDMDFCKFDNEWEHWNKWTNDDNKQLTRINTWSEDTIKSVINRMQDDLSEVNRVKYNSDTRDRLATSISIQLSKEYSFEMLSEAFNSVINKLIVIIRELNSLERPKFKDIEYEKLLQYYASGFNEKVLRVTVMKREYNHYIDDFVNLTIEDLKAKRATYLCGMLDSEFIGTHYEKENHYTELEREKYIDEITAEDGHLYLNEENIKAYFYLRQFIGYDSRNYYIDNEYILGKHIYKNRTNLTDEEINQFFQYMYMIEYVQKDMDDLFPKTENVEQNNTKTSRTISNQDAKKLEQQILDYVSVLESGFNGTPRQHTAQWRKIIKQGKKTESVNGHKQTMSVFEKKTDGETSFNKRVVHSIIGYMIRANMYGFNAPHAAKLLKPNATTRTVEHDINTRLEKMSLDEELVKNMTAMLE